MNSLNDNEIFVVGIDQSISSTGLAFITNNNGSIAIKTSVVSLEKEDEIQTLDKLFGDSLVHYLNPYKRLVNRVDSIVRQIKNSILIAQRDMNPSKNMIVIMEKPAQVGSNSPDITYALGFLAVRIATMIETQFPASMFLVPALTHKSLFFGKFNKQMQKKTLHEYHFDDAWKENFGKEITKKEKETLFYNDDLKDAFCLAYTGYLMFQKEQTEYENSYGKKVAEQLMNIYCTNMSDSKSCFLCYKYNACSNKDKNKFKTKKAEKYFQDKMKNFIALNKKIW